MCDMGGLIIAVVSFAYLVVSFAVARKAYRREYNLIYGAPAPRSYGGSIGHARAHEVARSEACQWLAMWPFFCSWALIERLISGPVPVQAKLDEAQAEVDRLAAEQDPLKDLDHTVDEITVRYPEGPEIILTPHPEQIRKIPLDPLPHFAVLAQCGDCICPKCRSDLYIWR